MSEPTVGSSSMPMFDVCRDMNNRTRQNFHSRLALFLIPAASGYTDQHLSATTCCTVDMPVVTAARLERDIGNAHLLARNGSEITVTDEILRVCRIRLADRKNHFALESGFGILTGSIFRPYAFCQIECRPCFRPTCIETDVSYDFGNLGTGNAVLLCRLKMEYERIVRDALTDERGNGYQTAVAQTEFVGTAPHFSKKNIIVEFCEFRSELP